MLTKNYFAILLAPLCYSGGIANELKKNVNISLLPNGLCYAGGTANAFTKKFFVHIY